MALGAKPGQWPRGENMTLHFNDGDLVQRAVTAYRKFAEGDALPQPSNASGVREHEGRE